MMRLLVAAAAISVVTACYLPTAEYGCNSDLDCLVLPGARVCDKSRAVCVRALDAGVAVSSSSRAPGSSSSSSASSMPSSSSAMSSSSSRAMSSSSRASSSSVMSSSSSAPERGPFMQVCNGACSPDAGVCIDTDVDVDNCGACGARCQPGEDCVVGQCMRPLAAGREHTCALRPTDGGTRLYCWGDNTRRQVGRPLPGEEPPFELADAVTGNYVRVSATDEGSCAYSVSQGWQCWGYDPVGMVAHGGALESEVYADPEPIPLPPGMRAGGLLGPTAGRAHACMASSSELKCVGANGVQQAPANSLMGILDELAAGGDQTCTISNGPAAPACQGLVHTTQVSGTAMCDGGLCSAVFGTVNGLPSLHRIDVGGTFGCGLTMEDTVMCWGESSAGQFGTMDAGTPVQVEDGGWLEHVATVRAGGRHACALTKLGQLFCWGDNGSAQLGTPSASSIPRRAIEVLPPTGQRWTSVECGERHTCAMDTAKRVWCWGSNSKAQLGVQFGDADCANPTTNRCRPPLQVTWP